MRYQPDELSQSKNPGQHLNEFGQYNGGKNVFYTMTFCQGIDWMRNGNRAIPCLDQANKETSSTSIRVESGRSQLYHLQHIALKIDYLKLSKAQIYNFYGKRFLMVLKIDMTP